MKRYLLKKLARAAEYTAERGQGWPTYWGFHELVADTNVKEMLKKRNMIKLIINNIIKYLDSNGHNTNRRNSSV